MKRILLTMLGALAVASSAQAKLDERSAKWYGSNEAQLGYSCDGWDDPEHIPNPYEIVAHLQAFAVSSGAETPEEIDQFTHIAWHEMYLKLKLLLSVAGHSPQ